MKNVRVDTNEVFSNPAATNTAKTASSRAPISAGTAVVSGLLREYEMVKAARRNWLSAVALSCILYRPPV